jgi:hypothetical protein
VRAARSGKGNLTVAARCELALLGIEHPTPHQLAGAVLRAAQANDTRMLRAYIASLVEED